MIKPTEQNTATLGSVYVHIFQAGCKTIHQNKAAEEMPEYISKGHHSFRGPWHKHAAGENKGANFGLAYVNLTVWFLSHFDLACIVFCTVLSIVPKTSNKKDSSGWSEHYLYTRGCQVRFLVSVHTQVASWIPTRGHCRRYLINVYLSNRLLSLFCFLFLFISLKSITN